MEICATMYQPENMKQGPNCERKRPDALGKAPVCFAPFSGSTP